MRTGELGSLQASGQRPGSATIIPTVTVGPGPGVHRSLEATRRGGGSPVSYPELRLWRSLVDNELPSDRIQAEGKERGVLMTCHPDSIERVRQVVGEVSVGDPGRCTIPAW